MSPGVAPLTRDVRSCRGVRSCPVDTCPRPLQPRVRTVPVCSVGDTSKAEMKSYDLPALAPLAITHPSPPSGRTGGTNVPCRGMKAIAMANLQTELPDFNPQKLPNWAEEYPEFLLLTCQWHPDVKTKFTLINRFPQQQVNTAINRSFNVGVFLNRLEQRYPLYDTDLSVRTEMEVLPLLPDVPSAARISEWVAQLEELMGRMNPTSYGVTEPQLWLVGKIHPNTLENRRETSEREAWTHSYDDLIDVLIELAMERENESHINRYLRKNLPR